ncbi:MAG: hydrogenase 4 subunit B [Candidatus Handelsmanbacteria bacterium RIFCSPLOWO2_12_FULL_64_10]|uniref:Hydrogenase 4 subunit B n=1 Tax=Handelsmanbacteria sp. (strain RIFCSPLOWO2_12_FULL_64_10) TaxID=1817868 RepID=A0A1F6CPW2_HANXR|nr:MAG: hydrogenase 4 subunit B [Candidatus Handelsmanbacteria bacterium RIFCSPLOWO2_12_FULL_64_10]
MTSETLMMNLLLAALACFGAGAAGALLTARWPGLSRVVGHGLALVGAGFVFALGAAGLMGGTLRVAIPEALPVGGLALGLDRLSAFFILVVAVGAAPSALYAIGYTRAYEGRCSLAGMGVAFNAFLAAMLLVPLARNVLTFLALWEAMSLASYFLVMTEGEREEVQRAGWVYLVMTHAGFACLLAGFLLMARATGTVDFAAWRGLSAGLEGTLRDTIFLLLALGFGSKAGVIPLHVWLPRAHPAAPSHVSALMSGVMIKLGVYGLVRVGFDWLGVGPVWWGGAALAVAALSAVLGVLYALVEHDLKRLLAYHSVENIGIILLGVGAGMLFQSYRLDDLASLALIAALYHTLNHATFKGLLFMGAGAVLHATHTRNVEEMGGLIKRMPQTAACFLVGSVAISALPPFNGFISEWLTFQSLLLSFQVSAPAVNLVFALAVAALALTGGLAAACFVKAFGITFLALPRSEHARNAREVGWTLRAPMVLLAVACLLLGVAPSIVLGPLNALALELTHASPEAHFGWDALVVKESFATASPLCLAVALVALLGAIPLALRVLGASARRRVYETWGCGRALQTARFEYTATAFANPFKRVFDRLYRPVEQVHVDAHPESRFFVRTITYRHETRSVFEDALYRPLIRFSQQVARRARILQSGNVHSYLLYILIALVTLLVLAR